MDNTKPIKGKCKYCEVKLEKDNVTFSKRGYLAAGRVCNTCRNRLYRFYNARPIIVNILKKLGYDDDKITTLLKDELISYVKESDVKEFDN
jgi:hypothetical protein